VGIKLERSFPSPKLVLADGDKLKQVVLETSAKTRCAQ